MNVSSLRNNRKFIIVGRKGVGKTAVQMNLSNDLMNRGYFTHHFRFMYDLRSDDYADVSKTQSDVSYNVAANPRKLFVHYDFRDVWERVIFRKIGEKLRKEGHCNAFVDFVAPTGSTIKGIFDGIKKSLRLEIDFPIGPALASIGLEPSSFLNDKDEVSLRSFNSASRLLFIEHCQQFQFYFFIDELVFSRLDAKDDEITLRAAMVRDIVRTAWELNLLSCKEEMDFHFITSLRPEIRTLINDLDSESGKFLDGKDVELTWIARSGDSENFLLTEVLKAKVENSHFSKPKFDEFMTQKLSFNSRSDSLQEFLLTNTWGRPRDLIRLLIAIQKKSPNSLSISQDEVKAGLDEYSRMSAKEIIDELSVSHGQAILKSIRNGIKKKIYRNKDELWNSISPELVGVNKDKLIDELFNLGVIGGVEPEKGRYYWSYRGETYLKNHHKIQIHAGLWNELSIRSS